MEAALRNAHDRNPQLLAAQAQGRTAKIDVEVTDNGILPALDLTVSAGPIGSSDDTSTDNSGSDNSGSDNSGSGGSDNSGSSGGSSGPEDSQNNDTPPPPNSPASQFEEFCKQNPGAC